MTTRRVFLFEYLSAVAGDRSDGTAVELRAEGRAMRTALQADLAAVPGLELSVADDRPEPPSGAADRSSTQWVGQFAGEPLIDFVARQAGLNDLVWVVAPETGGMLATLNAVVPPQRWIGCTGEAIGLASSKQATLSRLQHHGVATPLDFASDSHVRQWVVKPDDGAGSLRTRRHDDRAAALLDQRQRERGGEPASLEPWIDGDAMSLSLLVRDDRTEMLAVNRQRLAIDEEGWVSLIEVDIAVADIDEDRRKAFERIARTVGAAIPGLSGWVGIDLVWHAGCGPVVIEVNPRITSAYVGMSAALGRNLAAEILAAHDSTRSRDALAHVAC
ncbi:MAG: ATP-grasp domain-containing protein [Rhizobacter sp.]